MDVCLKELLTNYTDNLCDRTFIIKYQLNKEIKIRFYRESLCHLLGFQHIYNDKHYLGIQGYEKIKNEKIKAENLIAYNKKKYNYIKYRLFYFNKLKDVVLNGDLIKFYENRVPGKGTSIQADFVLYKNGMEFIYHLFLRKNTGILSKNDNIYHPVSFIPISIKDKNNDKYTLSQEHKSIIECLEIPDK